MKGTGKKSLYRPGTFWWVFLFTMLLKYSYYGLKYFPVVDDNNMYGVFSLSTPARMLSYYKMYTNRPAAALLDAYVWSRLWDNMWVVLLCMTLLHFLSSYLIWKVFEKNNFRMGIFAVVIFGLLPLGTEATYWIAASSRLVAGLFLAVLSFYLLMVYIEKRENNNRSSTAFLAAFFIISLISLGFYEQVIVFSFVCSVLLLILNFKRIKNKLVFSVPFINFFIFAVFYKLLSNTGNVAARGQIVKANYMSHTRAVFNRIVELFVDGQYEMYKNGIVRGFKVALGDGAFLFLTLAAAASILLGVMSEGEKFKNTLKANIIKFILGGFLLVLPFGPFFILETVWICNRNVFISFIGLGLMIDALIDAAFGGRALTELINLRGQGGLKTLEVLRAVKGVVLGVLVFAFLLINTAELADYRSVSLTDRKLVDEYAKVMDSINQSGSGTNGTSSGKGTVALFNAKPVYVDLTAEHFGNCTGNDWAFMGAVQASRHKLGARYILPVQNGAEAFLQADKLRSAVYIGVDDSMKMFPLAGEWKDDGTLELKTGNGALFGVVNIKSKDSFYFNLK